MNQRFSSWKLATIHQTRSVKGAGKNTPSQILVGENKEDNVSREDVDLDVEVVAR